MEELQSADHLLTRCVFTGEVWSRLLRSLGLALMGPSAVDRLVASWLFKTVSNDRHPKYKIYFTFG